MPQDQQHLRMPPSPIIDPSLVLTHDQASSIDESRRWLLLTMLSSATAACFKSERASSPFPARDFTFVIPNAAGGSNDLYARLLSQSLERRLRGLSVVPLNVAAGGGGKGILQLYRAAPDGYTLGILSVPGIFVLQHIRRLSSDFGRFTWLNTLTEGEHYGLAVPERTPVQNIDDLRSLSRRRPVLFSATGPESTAYSATMISAHLLGLRSRIVSGYRGSSDYLVAAIRGDTDAVVAPLAALAPMQGKEMLRLLATFEAKSSFPGVPDAETLGQPELASIKVTRVLAAPPGLPRSICRMLSATLLKCAEDGAVRNYADRLGEKLNPLGAEQTAAFVVEQQRFYDRWRSITVRTT